MHRRIPVSPKLCSLIGAQLGVVSRDQLLSHGVSRTALDRLKREGWKTLVPGVYLTAPVEPSREMRLMAAQLWHQGRGLIDGVDACVAFGLMSLPVGRSQVDVALPRETDLRSTGFVRVRRTRAPLQRYQTDRHPSLHFVPPSTAAVMAAARARTFEDAVAVLARFTQRRPGGVEGLDRTLRDDPPFRMGFLKEALDAVRGGARAATEAAFKAAADNSVALPPLGYNWLLQLPDRRRVSPDALCEEAGLVHEIDGWESHASRADDFDDTYERREAMVDAGLVVVASTGRQALRDPEKCVERLERRFRTLGPRGMPSGVTILRRRAP